MYFPKDGLKIIFDGVDVKDSDLFNYLIYPKKPDNNVDGTTVEAKCHPDDNFDIGVGIKEAFKKLNVKREEIRKQKEEEEKKIKVGDWVEVVDYLETYGSYPEWLYDKVDFKTLKNYAYGYYALNGLIGEVIAVGTHGANKDKKLIGFDSRGNVYIIGIEGVKKVAKPNV